jgi:hypothetical protein
MKRKYKFLLALMLSVVISGTLICTSAMAIAPPSITGLNAAYSNRRVLITGETTEGMQAVAILILDGDTLLRLVTVGVDNNSFSTAVNITLSAGTYTVKAADYEGGEYNTTTFTVAKSTGGSGNGSSPAAPKTTEPQTTTDIKTEGHITTETVTTTLADGSGNSITQTAATSTDSGTGNIDFSATIESDGSSAPIAAGILDSASYADTASVTVLTQAGAVTFDKDALEGLKEDSGGSLLTLSLEEKSYDTLPAEIKEHALDSVVFELKITSDEGEISEFDGIVTVKIAVPEKYDGKNVQLYHIAADGTVVLIEGDIVVKDGIRYFEFKTNHFSYYAIQAVDTLPFTDVHKTEYWYNSIYYVYANGLFAGTSKTSFTPDGNMTRGMLVTVLYRLEGTPEVTSQNVFTDVPDNSWYKDAVIWASENNIVSGYGNGCFGPNDPVLREQIAAILYRYAKFKGYSAASAAELDGYSDAKDIDEWALSAMEWAYAEGLIAGTSATTLSPVDNASRGQVATILLRFIEKMM